MKLLLRPLVESDLDEATRWYEERQPGLSKIFLKRVGESLARIEENPRLYAILHRDIRRAPLRQFPYGIYYALIKNEIHILAIVHDARHPSIWRRRR